MFLEFVEEQIILFIALGVVVAMLLSTYLGDKISGFTSVSADEAVRLYNNDAKFFDVRTGAEYKTGHIGEAVNISSTEVDLRINTLTKDKEDAILVYCQSGSRSAGVAKKLVKAGYTNVNNLSGGILAWKNAGLPINKPVSKKEKKKKGKNKGKNKND